MWGSAVQLKCDCIINLWQHEENQIYGRRKMDPFSFRKNRVTRSSRSVYTGTFVRRLDGTNDENLIAMFLCNQFEQTAIESGSLKYVKGVTVVKRFLAFVIKISTGKAKTLNIRFKSRWKL